MIDDITSDKTEGRASAYLPKSNRPPQALRSVSSQEKVRLKQSGGLISGVDLSTLTTGAEERHQGTENEIVLQRA